MIRLTQPAAAARSLSPGRFLRAFLLAAMVLVPSWASGGKLAEPSLAQSAKVTVDSSYLGYRAEVLVDRSWYAQGEERSAATDADRLGNGGNSWVSADAAPEHWMCLEWPLLRNIAKLHEESPGAATAMHWNARNEAIEVPGLVDGNLAAPAATLEPGHAVGVTWPVPHSIDSVALIVASGVPDNSGLVIEAQSGLGWTPCGAGLKTWRLSGDRRIDWTFQPTVTRAVRVRRAGSEKLSVAELEVLRFLPPGKDVWPERLTSQAGLEQEVLRVPGDPSFEALALCAHGMASTRFPIGLKDHPNETGVGWEGSLIDREKIQFRLGPEGRTLAECRDTLHRTLIDGWRPGVVVEAQLGDLHVRETAFAVPLGSPARPMVFVRLSVRNRSAGPRDERVEVSISGERPGPLSFRNGVLARSNDAVLLSLAPAGPGESLGTLRVPLPLAADEERHVDFLHPQEGGTSLADLEACRGASFDKALQAFCTSWDTIMATQTVVEVPEPRVNRAVKAVIAQTLINGDGDIMGYGAAPSVYEGALFGYEESFPMLGLALWGRGKDAQRYMSATYLTPDFLRKVEQYTLKDVESRHQQYRNGLQPHYAVSLFRLTRDEAWMRRHLPLLKQCAEWTMTQRRRTMQLENGRKPLHWGLLPQWAYGGDVVDVLGYPLFANLCCWRGLVDTAWALETLGDKETARRYRDEAIAYRADLDRAIEGSYLKDHQPPFLPLRVGGTKPDEMLDFYQLFAGCIFDVEPFARGSRHARWIADYLEQSNRTFCHLPRYRPMGPGALDAIYGKGYLLHLLHEDAIRDYLLGFYAYLAFNVEHETFVSRESNVLYPSDLHQRSSYPPAEITDPLTCASAVVLHLVRHMLVTEERGEAGGYSGNLLLLPGAPRAWLQDGKRIRLEQAPTHFGPMSLEVRSEADKGRIEARVTPPRRDSWQTIRLRLRHPEGRAMRSVQVDGRPWRQFDPEKEWILLPAGMGPCRVEATY